MKHTNDNARRCRILGLAAALCATTATSASAAPQDIIEGWVSEAAGNAVMEVSYGTIDHDTSDGRTTVTDLTVTLALDELAETFAAQIGVEEDAAMSEGGISYTIRFPSIAFDDLESADGYLSASLVEADTMELDVTIEVDDAELGDSSVTYEGLRATDLRWAEMPAIQDDAARPISRFVPLMRAAIDVSFSEMSVASATATSAMPEDEGEIVQEFGAMRLRDAERGDIAEMVIDSFAMTAPDPETGQTFSIEAGSIRASDYNYGTMIDVLLGDAETPDYVVAIGAMEMNNLRVSVPEEEFSLSIADISADDIGVRSPSMPILPFADSLVLAFQADPDFEPDTAELIGFIGAIYGSMRLGAFEVSDIEVEFPEIQSGSIAAYGLRDLSAEGLGSLYLRGVDFTGLDGELIRYDDFEIADVGFPSLQALVRIGMMTDEGLEPPIDLILQAIPTVGRIVNSGIRVVIPNEDADFALDGSVLEMTDHIGPIPTRIATSLEGLQVNVADLEDEARDMFAGLGYERLSISSDLLARWDPETSDLFIDGSADLEDGGRLEFDGTIGSVQRLIFERPDETGVMALLGATFKAFNARFEDDSIVERGMEFAGAEQGVPPETVRAQILAIVPVALAELGDAELAASATEAVSQLLENGAPMAVSVIAPAPLPIVALGMSLQGNPASILDALEIEVISE